MTSEQWKAVYEYCEKKCYNRPSELVSHLKSIGLMSEKDGLLGLGEMTSGGSYEEMKEFLWGYL